MLKSVYSSTRPCISTHKKYLKHLLLREFASTTFIQQTQNDKAPLHEKVKSIAANQLKDPNISDHLRSSLNKIVTGEVSVIMCYIMWTNVSLLHIQYYLFDQIKIKKKKKCNLFPYFTSSSISSISNSPTIQIPHRHYY